jgi:hypothetical protein
VTHDEAMNAARKGQYVRHRDHNKGWTIGMIAGMSELWCFNPHTGSEYLYQPMQRDKERTDWRIAKNKRDA